MPLTAWAQQFLIVIKSWISSSAMPERLGKLTPLAHVEPKVWDEVLAINLTSNYRLIRSMDALLRAAIGPRGFCNLWSGL